MDEEVHTLIDGSITAVKRPGPRGGWEYALGFPVDDMRALYDGPHSHVHLVIDEDITRRLARLISDHMGEPND